MNLLTKMVNIMPKEVISKYDAQYGILATVFKATHGVYIVIPIMNTFLAMKVPDAILRTNLLLNLQQKKSISIKFINTQNFSIDLVY